MRLFPEPAVRVAIEDVYGDAPIRSNRDLTSETRPYVAINMVASLDGKATVGGKVGAIGSRTDRTLMRNLRARADAVMVGAGTLRAEKLTLNVPKDLSRKREARGLKPQPLALIVTSTGNVPLQANLLGSEPDNLLIIVSSETPRERLAVLSSQASVEVVAAERTAKSPGSRLDLKKVLEILKKRYGVSVLLVEGGPSLNHALISSDLADELFLTLAPKLVGGSDALTILEGPPVHPQKTGPKLASVYLSGDELFLRYVLRLPDV